MKLGEAFGRHPVTFGLLSVVLALFLIAVLLVGLNGVLGK